MLNPTGDIVSSVRSFSILHFQSSITPQNAKRTPKGSFQLVEKAIFDFYASCGSTHSIEFALQIHKFREHVSRNLYKGRKNVPVGRGFSSVFARKRGFEREAARKTIVFRQPQKNPSGFFFVAQTRKESLLTQTLFPDSSKRKIMRLYHWTARVRPVRPQEQLRAFSPDASR